MGAIFAEQATVYVGEADIAPSALVASSATFDMTGYVTNYSESGMEEDVESIMVFGGGNIDKVKPRTQGEVSFDVILQYGTDVTIFDSFKWGAAVSGEYLSSGNSPTKQIIIQFTDGTNYYSTAFNNVKAVTFEPEAAADDVLKGTITFKVSPTTSGAVANRKSAAVQASALAAWS